MLTLAVLLSDSWNVCVCVCERERERDEGRRRKYRKGVAWQT